MIISVIIATYGQDSWADLAQTRAVPSAAAQDAFEVLVGHDDQGTLAGVRNALAANAEGEWLCFLDADDELAPGYLGAMKRAFEKERVGRSYPDGLLLTPAVSYSKGKPFFYKQIPLREGNWLCIGTLIPRALFNEIGGFREWPVFEDWDLWARANVPIVKVPGAIYRATATRGSRNRSLSRRQKNYWHQMIGKNLWPDFYDAPTEREHRSQEVRGVRKQLALC